jgi:Fe-S-cluster containining protein
VTTWALSIHADYRCQHSGNCCNADWDVAVELPIYRSLTDALAAGRLSRTPASRDTDTFYTDPPPDEGAAILGRNADGECVFFERGTRLCVVHRDLGEAALPSTCRHFPRIAVRDGRGTSITLSHFCPTAASMLFRDDMPLEVVANPHAFPDAEYEGLIVDKDAWPPLLHPRMVMDLEGYAAWERHMVRRCADGDCLPEDVIATLGRDAGTMRTWKPGGPTLTQTIASLPDESVRGARTATLAGSLVRFNEVLSAVPHDLLPAPDEHHLEEAYGFGVFPVWDDFQLPVNHYLAAKAFASWSAYQGRGLATIVRGLDAALALVRVEAARQCRETGRRLDDGMLLEAFRAADFMLNHLAAGDELARAWSAAENDSRASQR